MIYIDDNLSEYSHHDLDTLLKDVSPERFEKVSRLINFKDKLQSVVAFKLLKDALKTEYGLENLPGFSYNEYGKPFFHSYPEIHFNLSHCDKVVACAISNKPVGIDVEAIKPFDDELASYIASSEEYDQIISSENPELGFTVLWTKKESYVKLMGKNLGSSQEIKNLLINPNCFFSTIINKRKNYVLTLSYL